MKRILGFFLLTIMLNGCAGGYQDTPWQQTSQPAAAAPSQITAGTAIQPPQGAQAAIAGQTGMAQTAGQSLPAAKVALLLPLSGTNGALGQSMLQAAQLAVFDMGYRNFQLMPRDTKGTPEGARGAAEAAINDGSRILLGPLFSAEVKAVKPVAAAHNVSMVAFSTDWTQAGGNTFVMGFLPFSQVQRIVEFAHAKGISRIGLIAPQSEYGNAVVTFYQSLMARDGITSAPIVRIPAQGVSPDMAQAFTQNGVGSVDAVLIAVGGPQAAAVSAQLTQAGLGPDRVKRLGTGLWDGSSLSADANLQNGWYAAPQPELRRAFEGKYSATYGQAPPRLATLAYDATALAAVLARNGYANGGQPAFDRASLSNPNGFSGIDGVFRFQQDGLIDRGMAVLQMNHGAVSVIDPAPRTFQKLAY